jgi:hypothetical protein
MWSARSRNIQKTMQTSIKAEWLAQYLMGIIVPVLRKLSNKPISFSYLFFDLDSKTYKDSFMTRWLLSFGRTGLHCYDRYQETLMKQESARRIYGVASVKITTNVQVFLGFRFYILFSYHFLLNSIRWWYFCASEKLDHRLVGEWGQNSNWLIEKKCYQSQNNKE